MTVTVPAWLLALVLLAPVVVLYALFVRWLDRRWIEPWLQGLLLRRLLSESERLTRELEQDEEAQRAVAEGEAAMARGDYVTVVDRHGWLRCTDSAYGVWSCAICKPDAPKDPQ